MSQHDDIQVQAAAVTAARAEHGEPGVDDRSRTLPAARLDLYAEIQAMRANAKPLGHLAKTLVRSPSLRIVLMTLQRGTRIAEHHTDGTLAIQILDGGVRVDMPDGRHDLVPGQVLVIERDVAHAVDALEDSAILLTLAAPAH